MPKEKPEIQREYRKRKAAQEAELRERSALSLNIPKAVRHAALHGDWLAVTVMADTDTQILKKLEVHFFEAAKAKTPRPKSKRKT
jgi:hypothetical protein